MFWPTWLSSDNTHYVRNATCVIKLAETCCKVHSLWKK